MDISSALLGKCSPYIHTFAYDIDDRTLIIECMNDPKDMTASLRIIFENITSFKEQNLLNEFDDENLDDIVDISPCTDPDNGDKGYIITTYKKEITLYTPEKPYTEAANDYA